MTSIRFVRVAPRLAALVLALVATAPVAALPQRTFVASYGSDANTAFNCNLANPCRGFAAALPVTANGGEIVVLDSAGYGTFVVNKSVAITAPAGLYAGITVPAGVGVTMMTPGIVVTLRGLTISGQGGATGVRVTGGGAVLVIERCDLSNMVDAGIDARTGTKVMLRDSTVAGNGVGIRAIAAVIEADAARIERNASHGIDMTSGSWLLLNNGSVTSNGGSGIRASANAGAQSVVQVTLESSVVAHNTLHGIEAFAEADSTDPANEVRVHITGSAVSRNLVHGVRLEAGVNAGVVLGSTRNVIEANGSRGVISMSGSGLLDSFAYVVLSATEITSNAVGVEAAFFSNVVSYSNNSIRFNSQQDTIGMINKVSGD